MSVAVPDEIKNPARSEAFSLQTHVFRKANPSAADQLVFTQLYKRFERVDPQHLERYQRAIDTGGKYRLPAPEVYVTQNGRWYHGEGSHTEVALKSVPEWVWDECKAMSAVDRVEYAIRLPEELEEGSEGYAESPEAPQVAAGVIKLMVSRFDAAADDMWTQDGYPKADRLSAALGLRVTAKRIREVYSDRSGRPTPPRIKPAKAKAAA